MTTWIHALKDDPLPWLLEAETPAVRHLALRQLLDQPAGAVRPLPEPVCLQWQDLGGY